MNTNKLTLSAEPRVIADAKRLARSRHTSVSALFSRFVAALGHIEQLEHPNLGPVTSRAAGLVRLPAKRSDKALVEDALSAKFSA